MYQLKQSKKFQYCCVFYLVCFRWVAYQFNAQYGSWNRYAIDYLSLFPSQLGKVRHNCRPSKHVSCLVLILVCLWNGRFLGIKGVMWQLGYFECSGSKGYMQRLSVLDGNANSVDLVGKGSLPIEEPLRPSSNEYVDIG